MFCKVYVESADDFDLYANVIKVGSCEA
jgi:hypothetical protein